MMEAGNVIKMLYRGSSSALHECIISVYHHVTVWNKKECRKDYMIVYCNCSEQV